ncbi:SUMF1/EgtB/PvdO family nonheme iron enzyme [Plantactinospora sp. ZYX-F-223]|uniref:formylglycine-generating enzyme family protein n=1 Tax=Plantactinospora sp. ZYX-F-223 TaxID=3144103 RepID=UPI0031FDAD7A
MDDLLGLLPFALPSEAQWEYAARAGTTTLTFRGDGKPDEEQLLDDFADEKRTASSENAFGLAAMGSAGELCADVWIPGYAGAPTDARPRTGDGPRTVRGGAADLSPWQGCDEWLLLLSATRYEHAQFTAVRPGSGRRDPGFVKLVWSVVGKMMRFMDELWRWRGCGSATEATQCVHEQSRQVGA